MNIVTTIPKSKFPSWELALRVLQQCDGEERAHRQAWFWLVNCARLPKKCGVGDVCFMIYDGEVRGYFDIVDTDETESWRNRHSIGKARNTYSLILANWHPVYNGREQRGFQGYRYTEMRP